MAEVFSLQNTFGAGQRQRSALESAAQGREFNTLRMAGERQRQDIAERTFDADAQRANSEKMLVGFEIMKSNPNNIPDVLDEFVGSGIFNADAVPGMLAEAQNSPQLFQQKMDDAAAKIRFSLGQAETQPKFGAAQPATREGENVLIQTSPSGVTQEVEGFGPPERGAGGGVTGSLQELAAVNEGRAARGEPPLDAETFLTGRRENAAALQAFRQFKRDNPDSTTTFADFTAEQAGRVAGATEGAKQAAQIKAIPEKVQTQYRAEFKAAAPKRIRAANDQIARVDSVMGEAQLGLDDIGISTTGLLGSVNRKIAGTTAFALARKIDTLQANLSFDRIAEMRKNSPTGGALGQVSERELSLLGASVVALDQANNEDEVRRAFTKVLFHYNNWKAVITGQRVADELLVEGDISIESTTDQPIQQIDPALLEFMTPEERALFEQ